MRDTKPASRPAFLPTSRARGGWTRQVSLGLVALAMLWTGSVALADPVINPVRAGQQEASSIAVNHLGDYVVVWQDDQDGNGYFDLYARGFYADGSQRFATLRVNSVRAGQQLDPAVALDDLGRFVVAWEDDQDYDGDYNILVKGFDAGGSTWFSAQQVNNPSGEHRNPDISMSFHGDFAVAWQEDSNTDGYFNVNAQVFVGPIAQGNNFRVHHESFGQQINPAVGYKGANLVVAWQDDTDGNGYYNIHCTEFYIGIGSTFELSTQREIVVNSVLAGRQRLPDLALHHSGKYLVAWQDDSDGNGYYDIKAVGLETPMGHRWKDDFIVNQDRDGQQKAPNVSVGVTGDFVVTWQGDTDYDGRYDIRARGFYLSGNEKFRETVVDTVATGQKFRPGAASETIDGRTFFVWDGDPDGNGMYDIHSGQVGVSTCDLLSSVDVTGSLDNELSGLLDIAPELLEAGLSDYLEQFNHYRGLASQYTTFRSGGQMTEEEKQSDIMAITGSVFESEGREHFALVEVGQMERDGLISQSSQRRLERITYQLPVDCDEGFALPELILVEGRLSAKSSGLPISGVLREVGFAPHKRLALNLYDLPNWSQATRYDGQLYVGGDLAYKLLSLKDAAAIFDWDDGEMAGRGDLEIALKRGGNSRTFASGSTNVLVRFTDDGTVHHLAARGPVGESFLGGTGFVGDVALMDLPNSGDLELNGHWTVDSEGNVLDLRVAYLGFEMDYDDFAVGNMPSLADSDGTSLGSWVGVARAEAVDDVLDIADSALGALSDISGVAPLSPTLETTVDEIALTLRAVDGQITTLILGLEIEVEACVVAQYYELGWCSSPWPGYPCPQLQTLAEFCKDIDLDLDLDLLPN